MLKLLANISKPSSGSIIVNGTVAPLIEVGAGLVGDLTGRENIYLNGAILGISQAEIKRKFDDIVAFAELEEFIDTPIKRYSSGMSVRLGFAIATSVESDILIVDEVLSVGDLAFQRKCFDRMEGLIRREKRTVLLVSHNIRQVQRLCSRVILMDHGKVREDGPARTVCDHFYEQNDEKIRTITVQSMQNRSGRYDTTEHLDVLQVSLLDSKEIAIERLNTSEDLLVRVSFAVKTRQINPVFAIGIHTTDFLYLGTERSEGALTQPILEPGIYSLQCRFANLPLQPGVYSIRMSIAAGETLNELFYGENLAHFQITPPNDYAAADMSGEGFISLVANWCLELAITAPPHAESTPSHMVPRDSDNHLISPQSNTLNVGRT